MVRKKRAAARPRGLSLDCPCDHSFDDVFLHDDEKDHRRRNGQHHPRDRIVPIGLVAIEEAIHGDLQRQRLPRPAQDEKGQQEVVPHPHGIENDGGHRHRLQEREDDLEEEPSRGGAVDGGALVQLPGHRLHEAVVEEDREGSAQAPVDDGQPIDRSDEVTDARNLHQGDHEALEGDHHRGDAEKKEKPAEPATGAGELVAGHRAEQDHPRGAADGDDQRVHEEMGVVHERERLHEVVRLDVRRQAHDVLDDLGEALDRVGEQKEDRDQVDQHQRVEDDGQHDPQGGIFHASTSRLLKTVNWSTVTMSMNMKRTTDCAVP